MNADNILVIRLVCAFAAVREFRPIESPMPDYLTGPDVGFTSEEVTEEIFRMKYFHFILFVIVFLVTDYLRYKLIIIADGVAGILTYALLIGKPSIFTTQVGRRFAWFYPALDMAFYGYMYAQIEDKSLYPRITGYVRASTLFGKFCCELTSQLFVSFGSRYDELYLVYLSVGSMTVATILAFFFPPVKKSLYYHHRNKLNSITPEYATQWALSTDQLLAMDFTANSEDSTTSINDEIPSLKTVSQNLLTDFITSLSNTIGLAFWYSMATAGNYQVIKYSQLMFWKTEQTEKYKTLDGYVEFICSLLCACASYLIGKLDVRWTKHENHVLIVGSTLLGLVAVCIAFLTNLWLQYLCYSLFMLLFHTMLTIAEFEIAKHAKETCYGLVFGFISFTTLFIGTLWKEYVVEPTSFPRNINTQVEFLGLLYICLAAIYLVREINNLFLTPGSDWRIEDLAERGLIRIRKRRLRS